MSEFVHASCERCGAAFEAIRYGQVRQLYCHACRGILGRTR